MVQISLLSLLAATAFTSTIAAPVITYQTIVADIQGIQEGVQNFRADLVNYHGGAIQQTPLIGDFTEIEIANRKGYADANAASPFTAAGSTDIVDTVINGVGISIPDSINELKAKKPLFTAAGDDKLIVTTLETLLYDHDTFSAAVGAKLTADQVQALAVVAKIHDAIQDGIDYYSS